MYYYGARYYDPRISIFVSVDPLAEKTMTPYQYVTNNPIMFTDPTGMEADGIIEGKTLKGKDNVNTKALTAFASTEEGKSFLADYAKKGDKIGGQTFKEDGKYHKQGIDLYFGEINYGAYGARGKTSSEVKNGRAVISIFLNAYSLVSSQDGNVYDSNAIGKGLFSQQNADISAKAIISRGITIFHETFMHANIDTNDYLDDGKFNQSGISNYFKENYKNRQKNWDHYFIDKGIGRERQLFNTNGLKGIQQLNSQFFGKYYNNKELSKMMRSYSGSSH